jgi:hypothetical protein
MFSVTSREMAEIFSGKGGSRRIDYCVLESFPQIINICAMNWELPERGLNRDRYGARPLCLLNEEQFYIALGRGLNFGLSKKKWNGPK